MTTINPANFPAGLLVVFFLLTALLVAGVLSQIPLAYNMYTNIKG